jgi:hypothetical protein
MARLRWEEERREIEADFERKAAVMRNDLARSQARREELADLHERTMQRVAALEQRLARRSASTDRLPILARDLVRWVDPGLSRLSAAIAMHDAVIVAPIEDAVTLGPSPADVALVDRIIGSIKRLNGLPDVDGRPFHTRVDEQRLEAFQSRLREMVMLAERLTARVRRSRDNKSLLWHLMLAQRSEDVRRKPR